jgi:protein O-GlcNAcase/histone acetyltransferase
MRKSCVELLCGHKEKGLQGEFLAGVVEGFYGRPWTSAQRRKLFEQLSAWGLNAYLYAPKDDLKHRAIWRSPYDRTELAELASLIDAGRARRLTFIYGLSPGLDLRYADLADRARIRDRFQQLIEVGCQDLALLFDDLPGQIREEDRQQFDSLSDAHAAVANEVGRWLRDQFSSARLLFCPTPYCDRMERSRLGGADYLTRLGEQLDHSIDVLWTGPEIVSREIPVDSIKALSAKIQRPPVIWDNLHANDYDGQRLYTGPYSGRPLELKKHVAGILANPNNEFPINYIPLHTLAAYVQADTNWDPREAYLEAAREWRDAFGSVGDRLSLDDLTLLCDCYYLPHSHGLAADPLFQSARQLVELPAERWGGADVQFTTFGERIQSVFEHLTRLQDRELFYAWSRRVWDLKEEMQLIGEFAVRKRSGMDRTEIPSHLPGTYRGGLVAQLRSLLAQDSGGAFHPARPA